MHLSLLYDSGLILSLTYVIRSNILLIFAPRSAVVLVGANLADTLKQG